MFFASLFRKQRTARMIRNRPGMPIDGDGWENITVAMLHVSPPIELTPERLMAVANIVDSCELVASNWRRTIVEITMPKQWYSVPIPRGILAGLPVLKKNLEEGEHGTAIDAPPQRDIEFMFAARVSEPAKYL